MKFFTLLVIAVFGFVMLITSMHFMLLASKNSNPFIVSQTPARQNGVDGVLIVWHDGVTPPDQTANVASVISGLGMMVYGIFTILIKMIRNNEPGRLEVETP